MYEECLGGGRRVRERVGGELGVVELGSADRRAPARGDESGSPHADPDGGSAGQRGCGVEREEAARPRETTRRGVGRLVCGGKNEDGEGDSVMSRPLVSTPEGSVCVVGAATAPMPLPARHRAVDDNRYHRAARWSVGGADCDGGGDALEYIDVRCRVDDVGGFKIAVA
jgi:hypothetical protein